MRYELSWETLKPTRSSRRLARWWRTKVLAFAKKRFYDDARTCLLLVEPWNSSPLHAKKYMARGREASLTAEEKAAFENNLPLMDASFFIAMEVFLADALKQNPNADRSWVVEKAVQFLRPLLSKDPRALGSVRASSRLAFQRLAARATAEKDPKKFRLGVLEATTKRAPAALLPMLQEQNRQKKEELQSSPNGSLRRALSTKLEQQRDA